RICTLSPILMINFKRFTATFDSIDKLLHKVNYNELLNVTSYMTSDLFTTNDKSRNINSSTNNLYKLYAVINHIGDNLNSGHYYSYIRSSDNRWFLVDDAHCQHASSNEILNHPEAFMLFYVKASAHSTPINTSITLLNEQLSRNNSFIDMMTRIPFEDGKFQNKVRSKLTNTILNNELILG
ncbi:unnamed protein product, partial [Rotaria magnacalcarata]